MSSEHNGNQREQSDRELFDRIAANYCEKDLQPASRIARRHRLERTLSAVPFPANARILEVGCGAGFSAEYLRGRYEQYVGLDYSSELIHIARGRHRWKGVRFCTTNIADYTPDEKFDIVFAIGVIHHLADADQLTRRMICLLRPGGWLVANEPQKGNPVIDCSRAIRRRLDGSYSADQVEFSAPELLHLFRSHALQEVRVFPQGFFSTPFAEVVFPAQRVSSALSRVTCWIDGIVEDRPIRPLRRLAWNLVVAGRRPATSNGL